MSFSQHQQLHFIVVPLMSQSHLIPMTDFAKLLAKRGLTVTLITTPLNSTRFKPMVDQAVQSGHRIQLVPLRFPGVEAGLPENCESLDSIASQRLIIAFFDAASKLQQPLEKLMENLQPPPSCIITSNALPWTSKISDKFRIPRYVFNAVSCFTILCSRNISISKIGERKIPETESVPVPGMPYRVEFSKSQMPQFMRKHTDRLSDELGDQMRAAQLTARGVLVNSFVEMEMECLEEYKKVVEKTWCVGPVSLCNRETEEKLLRGDENSIDTDNLLTWLMSKDPGSVIYACFGSLCHISHRQLVEIGLGLEASDHPFIWIIRGLDCSEEIQNWLEKEKFQERNKGKGLVIQGWAPQILILSHPAIGGFLTHCGWNSTLEGVCSGVPMITWPMFAEQFYNEKLVTQVLGIGVRIGVEVGMQWRDQEEKNNKEVIMVRSEQVQEAIRSLMDGEGREEMRQRARELGEKGNKAMEEGGSSYLNITKLIQDVAYHHKGFEHSSNSN